MYKLLSLCQFGCWIKSSSELWESRNIKYRERKHYFLYYCLSASFLILTLIDSFLIELIYWKKFYVCRFYETLVNCHLAILFRKRNLLSLETYFSEKKKIFSPRHFIQPSRLHIQSIFLFPLKINLFHESKNQTTFVSYTNESL